MKLLYIGGAGRSGSTLLERIIDQRERVTALGEVTHLWDRGIVQDQLCGCGRPFHDCPRWKRVLDEAFPDGLPSSPEALVTLRDRSVGGRALMRALLPTPVSRAEAQKRRTYGDLLARVYRAAARRADAEVVVDSSKYPADAYLLRDTLPSDIELHLLHLVRDSNAVAYAWQREKPRPEIHWDEAYMPRYPWWQSAGAWVVFNAALERLGRDPRVRYLRVRYEDLTRSPTNTLASIEEFLGLAGSPIELDGHGRIDLDVTHTVSGNPSRFATGPIQLEEDTRWRDAPLAQRLAVAAMTAWHRWRYGYPAGPGP